MTTRRGLFSLLGCAAAAEAANIPEPDRVETLKTGGIYAVHFSPEWSVDSMAAAMEWMRRQAEPLGIKLIAFPDVKLQKLE